MTGGVISSNSPYRAAATYDWKRASIDPRTFRFDYCSCDTKAMVGSPHLPVSAVTFLLPPARSFLLPSFTFCNLPAFLLITTPGLLAIDSVFESIDSKTEQTTFQVSKSTTHLTHFLAPHPSVSFLLW
jgi:hypothetical protein